MKGERASGSERLNPLPCGLGDYRCPAWHMAVLDQPGHVTAARGFAGPDGSRAWPVEDIGDLGSLTSRIRIHYPERFSVALRIRGVERTGETRDAREQG